MFSAARFALLSRVVVLGLALLASQLGNEYDTSTSFVGWPASVAASDHGRSGAIRQDAISKAPLKAFVRWDAVYFLSIAQNGYSTEQEHAFFPGVSLLMRILAFASKPVEAYIGASSHMILCGLLVSNVSFVLAAMVLQRLTLKVLKDEKLAIVSAVLFCLNPASIFMSSIYSESLFALLTFAGMLLREEKRPLSAAILWGFASFVRANAIVLMGFFLFDFLMYMRRRGISISMFAFTAILCAAVASGFVAFQWYGYLRFCLSVSKRPWCEKAIPMIYSYVQEHYWNNGFLRYWTLQQLPNFIMAAPTTILSACGVWTYARGDFMRFVSLGMTSQRKHGPGFTATRAYPYVAMWLFLIIYCLTMMHVQVITRFFTSVPCIYWFASHLIVKNRKRTGSKATVRLLLGYCVLYGAAGIVLFSNFYPPA